MKPALHKAARVGLATPDGEFVAAFSADGLAALHFPGSSVRATARLEDLPGPQRGWAQVTARALGCLLAGEAVREWPPLDEASGTEFQQRVWRALRGIPAGETRTYGELARALGRPGSARAVGQACGANPIPVLTPCHRVVAAGGGWGGFSGGLAWKRRLLEREGGSPRPRGSTGCGPTEHETKTHRTKAGRGVRGRHHPQALPPAGRAIKNGVSP